MTPCQTNSLVPAGRYLTTLNLNDRPCQSRERLLWSVGDIRRLLEKSKREGKPATRSLRSYQNVLLVQRLYIDFVRAFIRGCLDLWRAVWTCRIHVSEYLGLPVAELPCTPGFIECRMEHIDLLVRLRGAEYRFGARLGAIAESVLKIQLQSECKKN